MTNEPLVLDLPTYRLSAQRVTGMQTWVKLRAFLRIASGTRGRQPRRDRPPIGITRDEADAMVAYWVHRVGSGHKRGDGARQSSELRLLRVMPGPAG